MLRKALTRAAIALAAGTAVVATAVPANAASYSAFAFSRTGSQPTIYPGAAGSCDARALARHRLAGAAVTAAAGVWRAEGALAAVAVLEGIASTGGFGLHPTDR